MEAYALVEQGLLGPHFLTGRGRAVLGMPQHLQWKAFRGKGDVDKASLTQMDY